MRRSVILTSLIVAAIGVLAAFAAADALRSGGSATPAAPTTASLSTEQEVVTPPSVTPGEVIVRTVNNWARLFAAGRSCNRYMTQPACERIVCERVGGIKIRNCTPMPLKAQRSFADATVQDIWIGGDFATVRLSNGETVEFDIRSGWISKVGGNAGGTVFE